MNGTMKQKPSLRLYWNKFRHGVVAFFFVRRIGRVSHQFDELTDPVERMVFLQEHMGKEGLAALQEREWLTSINSNKGP